MTFEPDIFPTSRVINALCPNAIVAVDIDEKGKETIRWIDMKGDSKPTDSQITAKKNELEAAYDSKKYRRDRKSLYPEIGDQLDDLYKQGAFSADMAAKIKKGKDDNPKL